METRYFHTRYFHTIAIAIIIMASAYSCLNYFRTLIHVSDGGISHYGTKPANNWFHIVVNYFGPNNEQGFKTYFNGNHGITDSTKWQHNFAPSNRKIVIGRLFVEINHYYTSMSVDELLIFNHTLTLQEINSLYNI